MRAHIPIYIYLYSLCTVKEGTKEHVPVTTCYSNILMFLFTLLKQGHRRDIFGKEGTNPGKILAYTQSRLDVRVAIRAILNQKLLAYMQK